MVEDEKYWWHSLNEECPITLESLSTLPYPPFSLTTGSTGITSYFDGLALASYIVSRGIFQNPLTREDLTMADCRRLDDYLETHCYTQQRSDLSSSRKISVAEAFALKSSVHVDPAIRDQSRAQILQSTATAALAGLFIYGNDRRQQQQHQRRGRGRWDESAPSTRTVLSQQQNDQLMLDWGFDLTRTVHDASTEYASHGWTIIDDDEAMVVASEREAYQATQDAFPPLNQTIPLTSSHDPTQGQSLDEHILQRIRELSLEEERERKLRQRQLELAQKRRLERALARRDERQRKREQQRAQEATQWETKQQEQEEIQRARKEIELWREEQWRKLRLLSETQERIRVSKDDHCNSRVPQTEQTFDHTTKHDDDEVVTALPDEEIDELNLKKAKAAEKRKRAKQRKKEQKAEQQVQRQKASMEQEEAAKKTASALKCELCGEGILDGGFEKYGSRFCSTKCARSAQPNRLCLEV